MKSCPVCKRSYADGELNFCLDDGEWLTAAPDDEPPTRMQPASETAKPPFSTARTTDQTAILPETSSSRDTRRPTSSAEYLLGELRSNRRVIAVVGGILLLTIVGLGYWYLQSRQLSITSKPIASIAVLPFENRSGNADTDYLSDGLTDSLIFRFSQLPNLNVSPTSSVMRYKGNKDDIGQIATELRVDAVLSGRLLQLGDNLTISVELVDARTKNLVWKEQYERKMSDLLATQREIATTLTQKMQLKLAGDEKGLTKKYTSSNEAYQLYLKGRYHWSRRTRDDLLKAIDNYKSAIDIDPNFALAYAATAEVYNSMGKNPDVAPKDCIPLAKAAATRALEIDPALPQAHSALADSLALYDWDWAESERHFKKALELDPNISYTYVAYGGSYLEPAGKPDEAVAQLQRAVALEPLAMINNCILTTTYIYARQFDKALAQGKSTYDLDSTFPFAPHWLGFALIANGKYDDAISLGQRVSPDSPFSWMSAAVTGLAYAKLGKRMEAEQQILRLRELGKTRYVRPYYLASIYAAMGNKDSAFAELERSFAERDCYLGRLTVDPFMDPLRDDARFRDLLKRMNLLK